MELFDFIVPTAWAQDPCVGVPGGCGSANMILPFIPAVGALLVTVAGGATVLFMVIGGVQMMLMFGDEGRASRGRNSMIMAGVGFAIVLASQTLVNFVFVRSLGAVGSEPVIDFMAVVIRFILSLFNIVFAGVCVAAGYRMVLARGQSEEFGKGRTMLIWVCTGALCVNVAHAIAQSLFGFGF